MKNDHAELLDPFRKRLAELAPKTPAEQIEHMSLPALYEAALSQTPRLHSDRELCLVYKALGALKERGEDGLEYWLGIATWIDAGMSPAIYFTGFPEVDSLSRPYLEILQAYGLELPDAAKLLGNLSLRRFTHFWTDRSSLLSYGHACEVIDLLPELLAPQNWRNFEVGEIDLHPRARKKLSGRLRSFVPLLCLHQNMTDSQFYFAKNALQLHSPDNKDFLASHAILDVSNAHSQHVLERFVQLEYGGWDNILLDNILVKKLSNGALFSEICERTFWIDKAFEVITQPTRAYIQAWPSALYADIVRTCSTESYRGKTELYDQIVHQCQNLKALEIHASKSAYALARSLESSNNIDFLVSPVTLSILKPEFRADFIDHLVGNETNKLLDNIKKGRDFAEARHVHTFLQQADPLWATAITHWVQRHFSIRDFKPGDSGMASIAVLLTYPLRGAENKEKAIAWCRSIRSPKWKIETMHALNLSPQDININDRQKEDFLSRDLGL